MTPLQFQNQYEPQWRELATLLQRVRDSGSQRRGAAIPGDRLASLYRRVCEQLSLARARAYPAHLIDRLAALTDEAHQFIYQQRDVGARRLLGLFTQEFPRAVRAHASYVWIAAGLFMIPAAVLGILVYLRPELILSVVDADRASQFESMYASAAESIGRSRAAATDLAMFGFYIRNNIGVAFQCFAGGLFAGVGSVFYLLHNGAEAGAIAGYLSERGLQQTFFSFVVTHSAFELTAIVLSGAGGLRLGHAWLAPGRATRLQSLVLAARESVVMIYGVIVMLLIAACIEAFWSSAATVLPAAKYAAGAVCWLAVFSYLILQGRREG